MAAKKSTAKRLSTLRTKITSGYEASKPALKEGMVYTGMAVGLGALLGIATATAAKVTAVLS
jgi:hypothetical protein